MRAPDIRRKTRSVRSFPSPSLCLLSCVALLGAACSSAAASAPDSGIVLSDDAGADPGDGGAVPVEKPRTDGGFVVGDGGVVVPDDTFATKVVSYTKGACGGFGASFLPSIVLGPPAGAGDQAGSLDVVSLGNGGEIVLSVEPNAIVDGPGSDFVVFENAFFAGGDRSLPFVDLGEVSVSNDGVTWVTFPCTAIAAPYGSCAGWSPVYSAPDNGISPLEDRAGGDRFDLATIGVPRAKLVRIRDKGTKACSPGLTSNGFDLDALAVLHGAH